MVYFITGPVNSGKSNLLLSLYNKQKSGDGFYNRKVISKTGYTGQDIVWLSTGVSMPFSVLQEHIPKDWDETYSYKDYSFSRSGLCFTEIIIDKILNNREKAFIDEIGPLELNGKGIYKGFCRLLQSEKDIYAVVRDKCLPDIINKFNIEKYHVI